MATLPQHCIGNPLTTTTTYMLPAFILNSPIDPSSTTKLYVTTVCALLWLPGMQALISTITMQSSNCSHSKQQSQTQTSLLPATIPTPAQWQQNLSSCNIHLHAWTLWTYQLWLPAPKVTDIFYWMEPPCLVVWCKSVFWSTQWWCIHNRGKSVFRDEQEYTRSWQLIACKEIGSSPWKSDLTPILLKAWLPALCRGKGTLSSLPQLTVVFDIVAWNCCLPHFFVSGCIKIGWNKPSSQSREGSGSSRGSEDYSKGWVTKGGLLLVASARGWKLFTKY